MRRDLLRRTECGIEILLVSGERWVVRFFWGVWRGEGLYVWKYCDWVCMFSWMRDHVGIMVYV